MPQHHQIEIIHPLDGMLLKEACLQVARLNVPLDWFLQRDEESIKVFSKGRGDQFVAAVRRDTAELVGLLAFFDGYKDPLIVRPSDFQGVYGYWFGWQNFFLYKLFVFFIFCSHGKYHYCNQWVRTKYRKSKMKAFYTTPHCSGYSGIWQGMVIVADSVARTKPCLADVRDTRPKVIRMLKYYGFQKQRWSLTGWVLSFFGFTRLISFERRIQATQLRMTDSHYREAQ